MLVDAPAADPLPVRPVRAQAFVQEPARAAPQSPDAELEPSPPAVVLAPAERKDEEQPAPTQPTLRAVPAEPAPRPEPARAAAPERPVSDPPVEVRIGRVEVRLPSPPAEPRRRPRSRPRGFSGDSLARRYVDRRWY